MSDSLSSTQANILRFIPDIILNDFIKRGQSRILPPERFNCRAIMLVTNILQFSHLTQTLLTKHHDGIEMITEVHKAFVLLLQNYLGKTGGDILKYSTDKFIMYWPVSPTNVDEYISELSRVIVYQILSLQEAIATKFHKQGISLKVSFI